MVAMGSHAPVWCTRLRRHSFQTRRARAPRRTAYAQGRALHESAPLEAVQFAQGAGRGGRGGRPCRSVVVYDAGQHNRAIALAWRSASEARARGDHAAAVAVHDMLVTAEAMRTFCTTTRCRRRVLLSAMCSPLGYWVPTRWCYQGDDKEDRIAAEKEKLRKLNQLIREHELPEKLVSLANQRKDERYTERSKEVNALRDEAKKHKKVLVYEREKLEKLCKLWRQAVDKRFKTYEPLSWAPPPQQDPAAAA